MAQITKDTIIGDILDIAPETAPIFLSIGMHCLGCPSSRSERPAWSTAWTWTSCWPRSTPAWALLSNNRKKGAVKPLLFS